jgi:hypothetical protein
MTGANEMTTWPPSELARIGGSEELKLASRRADGSLRPYVTIGWYGPTATSTSARHTGPTTFGLTRIR